MEYLTQFVAPIVSLWVIHNAIFSSARFVNEMRETVISGWYEGQPITREHRRVILADWRLCIWATIAVCLIFAAIVLTVSITLSDDLLILLIGVAIACYPVICAGGFAKCSIADRKLMVKAIENAIDRRPRRPRSPPP
jgi:hypothetical protein